MWNLKVVEDGIIVLQREYKNVEDAIRAIGLKYYEKNTANYISVSLTFVRKQSNTVNNRGVYDQRRTPLYFCFAYIFHRIMMQ